MKYRTWTHDLLSDREYLDEPTTQEQAIQDMNSYMEMFINQPGWAVVGGAGKYSIFEKGVLRVKTDVREVRDS